MSQMPSNNDPLSPNWKWISPDNQNEHSDVDNTNTNKFLLLILVVLLLCKSLKK